MAQPNPSPTRVAAAERLRTIERRAVVEGLSQPLQDLKITDLGGRDISREVQPRLDQGVLTMNFERQTPVVLKPKAIETLVLRRADRLTLPGGVILPTPDTGAPAKPVWFHLTLVASPTPAAWDPHLRSYVTRLTFGLKRTEGAPGNLVLDSPVQVKVGYQGLAAAEETIVTIEAPGLENEKTVALQFTPLTAKPTLLVRSSLSDVNLELMALPRLDVQPARDRLLGFGLDRMVITVTNVSPEGRSVPVARDTPVVVEVAGRAQADDEPLVLKTGQASAQFTLRSSGLGSTAIKATADGVSGLATVSQRFPTGPLIAALLGGALGGLARRFVKGAQRALTRRRIVEGLVIAVIAFVAGVLGVGFLHLPAAIVATEAGAFLTGSLAGFAGVSVLETYASAGAPP